VVQNNLFFGHEIDPGRNQGGPKFKKIKTGKFFGFENFQKNWNWRFFDFQFLKNLESTTIR